MFIALIAIGAAAVVANKDEIIKKIMGLEVKKVLAPDFIQRVIVSHKINFSGEVNFDEAYYSCRDKVFDAAFDGYEMARENYVTFRTITVSLFKKQLHAGNMLRELYEENRFVFKQAAESEGLAYRKGLLNLLERTSLVFASIADENFRASAVAFVKEEERKRLAGTADEYEKADKILALNLSPEETYQKLSANEQVPAVEVPIGTEDPKLLKFALRRWNEGGIELVRKYQTVISMALKDVREVSRAQGDTF